jgi:hypothetical protein
MYHFAGLVEQELDLLFRRNFLIPQVTQVGVRFAVTAVFDKVVNVVNGFVDSVIHQTFYQRFAERRSARSYKFTQSEHVVSLQ